MKSVRMKWFLMASAAIVLASGIVQVEAKITTKVGQGDLDVTGFFSSEMRGRVADEAYFTQFIQKFQLEAELSVRPDSGFDEISLFTILRPEFDLAHYYGDTFTDGHVGRDADKPSYLGSPFGAATDPIGFNGFGGGLSTGGLNKNVVQGFFPASFLTEFEVLGAGSGFPLVSPISDRDLACDRCTDVDNSHRNIALTNTDSSGALYPVRELYLDAKVDDWWFRVGKQQIVWGKTDFFRLQDIVNPVDFGQHFFFDSFEDIRIPQWIASAQYRAGTIGPLTDVSVQGVWNFDRFRSVGLGNPSSAWAHPFGKEGGVFALFNTYFSPEPCVSPTAVGATPATTCAEFGGLVVGGMPSGFGVPLGLSKNERPDHELGNTEGGARAEFRLGGFFFALSHYYGWGDGPVFKINTINVNATGLVPGFAPVAAPGVVAANDGLVVGLTEGITLPVTIMEPNAALAAAALAGGPLSPAGLAVATNNASLFYRSFAAPGLGAVLGSQVSVDFQQAHTTGVSADYFDEWSGIVFRLESSFTGDEYVNNTRKANWTDESDVVRYSIGLDRQTIIPMLNPVRTFFLSAQLFDTWYLDHEGTDTEGMFNGEHNYIVTAFANTKYLRDQLTPQAFAVWEEESNSKVLGFSLEYLMNNNASVTAGGHFIWEGDDNGSFDVGPFTSFTLDGNFAQPTVFGYAREGIGAFSGNDELYVRVKYQF